MIKILPLLLRGLDLSDETIRAHVVDTIHAMASDESSMHTELIEEYAYTIVNALLQSSDAQHTKSSVRGGIAGISNPEPNPISKQLRYSSLRCIGILPSTVKYSVLHPYKQKVISQLGRFIDDPKRHVRKEAVDARYVISYPFEGSFETFNRSNWIAYST